MAVEEPLHVLFFGCCGCTSNIIMKEAIHEVHCTIDYVNILMIYQANNKFKRNIIIFKSRTL